MGGEGDIVVTSTDLERGVPQEPPMPSLDLTVFYYKGKEIYPTIV